MSSSPTPYTSNPTNYLPQSQPQPIPQYESQSHRNSQSYVMDHNTPPPPPPKPNSQDVSRQGTPAGQQSQSFPRPGAGEQSFSTYEGVQQDTNRNVREREGDVQMIQDPGDQWLPKILENKSKQDLAAALSNPALLAALTHSTSTAHSSIPQSQAPLISALDENISLATHLLTLESRLDHLRTSTQSLLMSTHALERQWKQKQIEMDRALAPFSPSELYRRLGQGVQEQEMMCIALEESFLERDGEASEREAVEWVKRFREGRRGYYARRERKERWDEGRVGGWR